MAFELTEREMGKGSVPDVFPIAGPNEPPAFPGPGSKPTPPGDTIRDILRQKEMSVEQFRKRMGILKSEIDDFLAGKIAIDDSLAYRLADLTGLKAIYWLRADYRYRSELSKSKRNRTSLNS
jgi:plasmid maintenance system antidote protein VapI